MKRLSLFFAFLFLLILGKLDAQTEYKKPVFQTLIKSQKAIVENKGQYADINGKKVLFTNFDNTEEFYFTNSGLIIKLDTVLYKKPWAKKLKDVFEKERETEKEFFKETSFYLYAEWQNTNPDVKIEASEKTDGDYIFGKYPDICNGFQKITYKNIYPNIDIEYTLPSDSSGIKYNIILHPGADASNILLKYSGDVTNMFSDNNGNIVIKTPLHNIIEHAPKSFYSGATGDVASAYILNNNEITFYISENNPAQTLIIDPWISGITGYTNPYGYDVEYDWSNNLYVYYNDYNGSSNSGLYVRKFSPTGTLLWTHTITSQFTYEGNFMLDKLANKIYISEGFNGGGATAYRINTSNGVADGFVSQQNASFREMWDMAFDCNLNRIIGVGGGTNSNLNGGLINPITGAVTIANFTGLPPTDQDIASQTVDGQGNLFVVYAYAAGYMDNLISLINSTLNGNVWQLNHGMYGFGECVNHAPVFSCSGPGSNAFNGLDVNNNYLYFYDGGGLAAYNKATGAQIAATSVSWSGQYYISRYQGGIAVDDCDNIYIGGPKSNILMYHFNGSAFTQLGNMPLGWTGDHSVFDIKYDKNTNLLYVSGHNNVGVFTATQSANCTNNSITNNAICTGQQTGSGTVTISTNLSNPVITYTWYDSGGNIISTTSNSTSLSNTVPGLTNGTYIVHAQINPACGPVLIDTVVVFCPICSAAITTTPVTCYGGNNGSATVTPSGGTAPYTYVWSPTPGSGQGTPNVSGYPAGTINVTVTDGNNCVATATATITQPAAVAPVITNTSVLCNGGSSGTATATVTGGTPNYSYNWSPAPGTGQGTDNIGGLSAVTYSLTVTDANGCTGTSSTVIAQPPALSVSINHTNVTCNGGNNGTATATVSGGTPSYSYSWLPIPGGGQGTPTPTGLSDGTYSLTVTDNNGCSTIQNVIITQPPQLVISATANPPSVCPGGSSTLTATGANTYTWAPSADLSATTGSSVTATPTASNTYYVTGTDVNGCTATTQVGVSIYVPPTATFTAQTPICAGDPASIVYLGSGGVTYNWNFNGATILTGTLGTAGPFTITWNTANTYAITLQVTDANGCVSDLEIHYIQVVGAGTPSCCTFPTPDAGPDLQFCGLTGNFNAVAPDDLSYVGTWTQISGGGISTFGNSHSTTSSVTVNLAGTYQYQWDEANGPCDSADVVTVTFIQNPIANAGPDTTVCGLNYNMIAQPSSGTGTWTGTGIANPNSPTSAVSVVAYGTYTYGWTENNLGCTNTDSVQIEFLQVPVADAGIDGTGCGFNYTLSADSTYPGYWSGPINVIYLDGYTESTTGVLIPNYTGSSYTATFTWHAQNGICTDNDNVNVTFIRPPHAEAGPPQDVCGAVAQVLADTIGSGLVSGYWTVNPSGPQLTPFNPYGADVDISVLGNNAYNNQSVGIYYLIFVADNGQGCAGKDSLKITFYDTPVADAGPDTSVCGKSYNLSGTWSIDNPVGQWSTISGPGTANFVNPTNNTTSVTVTQFGIYQFVWKESNALQTNCSDRDTITIDFKVVPMPDAGLDFAVCGKFAYICADTTVSGGSWSCPQGGVAYYDAENGNITPSNQFVPCTWIRYPSENVTVTMYWSEFNGVCYGYDSVNVRFKYIPPAIELVDPTDTFVCGPTFYDLNAQSPTNSSCWQCTGYWIDTVMNTVFSVTPNGTNTNPIATIDTGGTSYYGWHNFYWITQNGQCRDTSQVVQVLFIEKPVANAGLNYWPGLFGPNNEIKTDTVCGLSWQMGAIPSVGTGTWYSQGLNVHFDSLTGPPTTSVYNDSLYLSCSGCYTVFNMTGDKYREFIWQENNNGCFDSDTIRLYFAPYPSGEFTTTVPQCRHDSSMIIATTWPSPNNVDYGLTNFSWLYPGGVLDSSIVNPDNSDTIYVSWATGEQHPVTLITTNQWGCQSGIVTHNVVEPIPFNPNYDLIAASCGFCNGEVELNTSYISPLNDTITNYYTFNWVDSIFNNSSAQTQTGLCPETYYNVVVNGQSLSIDATPGTYCHDSIQIYVPDTGYVIAQFDTLILEQNEAAPYNVQFINTSIGGRKYSWRIYDESGELVYTSTLEAPLYTFNDEGCYQIVLVATSKWNCKDTAMFNPLCVDAPPLLEVPNSFTPNNDGQNDYFQVHSKSILEFHAVIYNRWGKKLYEWDNADGYWDGKINGTNATPGVYYYIITAKGKKETDYEFKGFFYLLKEK